ncbi:MAG: YceD family protein [Gammaproteobacteria bacterium]|jgi:uncharacterized protein
MSRQQARLPHQIDPFRLAEAGSHLSGKLPLRQFKRLAEVLSDNSGELAVALEFDVDELGVPVVRGNIQATLMLTCQRCLEAFAFPVDIRIALAWVRTEQDADRLPLRYEAYLVEEIPLQLNDMIEDELLLALPQIPMHQASACPASKLLKQQDDGADESEQQANPFAVLAKLKHDE